MAENLSEEDASVVFDFLYDARVKWYVLGLQLKGLPKIRPGRISLRHCNVDPLVFLVWREE